ncbi:MAG: pilus assembly protein [Armatimonadetes bacterium]|nr:pilus assembly protein [Armatimonadota bacterium]
MVSAGASRGGQAIVELALAIFLLLLLALGIVQFGTLYSLKLRVEHAAGEGARYAAIEMLHGATDSDIIQHTLAAATDLDPAPTVTLNAPVRQGGEPVTITVSYSYVPDVAIVGDIIGPMTLTGTAEGRLEAY